MHDWAVAASAVDVTHLARTLAGHCTGTKHTLIADLARPVKKLRPSDCTMVKFLLNMKQNLRRKRLKVTLLLLLYFVDVVIVLVVFAFLGGWEGVG